MMPRSISCPFRHHCCSDRHHPTLIASQEGEEQWEIRHMVRGGGDGSGDGREGRGAMGNPSEGEEDGPRIAAAIGGLHFLG